MIEAIEPFRAIAISRQAHAMKAEGRRVFHMEFGQPSTGAPATAIARAKSVLDTDAMGYWESQPLKDRISQHYAETYGVTVAPSRLAITCGASPALVLALASAFQPGDRVALARPGYVAYRNTLKALHLVPVEIPCGPDVRFQLSAGALARLDPAPKGIIIASPANPTGTIIPPTDLSTIAAYARANNVIVVSDEIYHGLTYGPATHSMLEFLPEAYIVNSFSKYFSMAGWRLGWLVTPEGHEARTSAYIGNLFLTAPSLAQHAGLAAFEARDELDGHLRTYTANRARLLEALPRLGLERIAPPDGAFYIYADVSRHTDDSLGFCLKMLEETGVATAPGIDFDPEEGHHFMRFSFALSTDEIGEALTRLEPWFMVQPKR